MNKKGKKDKCVLCKKDTQYDEFDHIDLILELLVSIDFGCLFLGFSDFPCKKTYHIIQPRNLSIQIDITSCFIFRQGLPGN